MITAIIADDEPLARERVRSVLKDEPEVEIVAECADGAQALKETQKRRPDLLFLDVQMPRLNGFELPEALSQAQFQSSFSRPLTMSTPFARSNSAPWITCSSLSPKHA